MRSEPSRILELIAHPRESLAIELKRWIDPTSPVGIAKIVKASIALRNNNGGYLLIGFDDETGLPINVGAPSSVHDAFQQDRIQGEVTKYSSESFEVHVHLPDLNGCAFPVLEIEAGVRTPIATRAELRDGATTLIPRDRVYVRSLNSNNVVSTTEATWKDWPRIMELCFENREADIGRFLRRHLSGMSRDGLEALFSASATATPQSPSDKAKALLDTGATRYSARAAEVRMSLPTNHGTWEVAAVVEPALPTRIADLAFLNSLMTRNPQYTGWPVWLDSRHFRDRASQPGVFDDGWEALIETEPLITSRHLDFWRLEPSGKFYLRRVFQDDLATVDEAPEPGTQLDFGLVVLRTAEAVAVALEFARALIPETGSSTLAIATKWSVLRGRELSAWASRARHIIPGRTAFQDVVVSSVAIPIDTPASAIAGVVEELVAPIFSVFDGFRLNRNVIEDLCASALRRNG